jgi:KaiC/GvpD/RAD55 family RecA-like ATPase
MADFAPKHVRDLAAEVSEAIEWVWYRMVPVGSLVLLCGYMKSGKSTLAYELAVAVSQGRPFLGFRTLKGPVLIIAAEEHRRDVLARLRHFGMTDDDPVWVEINNVRDDQPTLEQLKQFIKDQRVVLVVIDTLSSFINLADETNASEVTRHLKPFVDICRDTDAATLLIHHERKNTEAGDPKGIRGSGAIFALVDQALLLYGGGNGTQRTLKVEGRYRSESPRELVLDFVDERYISKGTPDQNDRLALETRVLAVLAETEPGRTIQEVADAARMKAPQARRALNDATAHGTVRRHGHGVRRDPHRYVRVSAHSTTSDVGVDVEYPNGHGSSRNAEGEAGERSSSASPRL